MEDEGIERRPYGRGTKWTASDLELLQKLIDDIFSFLSAFQYLRHAQRTNIIYIN